MHKLGKKCWRHMTRRQQIPQINTIIVGTRAQKRTGRERRRRRHQLPNPSHTSSPLPPSLFLSLSRLSPPLARRCTPTPRLLLHSIDLASPLSRALSLLLLPKARNFFFPSRARPSFPSPRPLIRRRTHQGNPAPTRSRWGGVRLGAFRAWCARRGRIALPPPRGGRFPPLINPSLPWRAGSFLEVPQTQRQGKAGRRMDRCLRCGRLKPRFWRLGEAGRRRRTTTAPRRQSGISKEPLC